MALGRCPGQAGRMNALVVYASTHGHTGRIAARVADVLRSAGASVTCARVEAAGAERVSDYDLVVVGASIHHGQHQDEAEDWVRHHATALNGVPSAFFSVSLAAADHGDRESQTALRRWIDDFLDDTGWTPRHTIAFAGALQYREYDFLTQMMMRVLMKQGHHPTDVTRDYDYTDWAAVEDFARDCAAMLQSV
jgi:menaquinone-dependent protoporphyrinogen oxidase